MAEKDEITVQAITAYRMAGLSPEETCEDLGLILGHRVWRVYPLTQPLLLSLSGVPWPPGKALEAVCPARARQPTATLMTCGWKMCECGIYACKANFPEHIRSDLFTHIAGSVALWGEVREHEEGYRATRAYPLALERSRAHSSDEEVSEYVDQLPGVYGIPVLVGPSQEWAFPDPDDEPRQGVIVKPRPLSALGRWIGWRK